MGSASRALFNHVALHPCVFVRFFAVFRAPRSSLPLFPPSLPSPPLSLRVRVLIGLSSLPMTCVFSHRSTGERTWRSPGPGIAANRLRHTRFRVYAPLHLLLGSPSRRNLPRRFTRNRGRIGGEVGADWGGRRHGNRKSLMPRGFAATLRHVDSTCFSLHPGHALPCPTAFPPPHRPPSPPIARLSLSPRSLNPPSQTSLSVRTRRFYRPCIAVHRRGASSVFG